jgi:hypothetical protein
MEQVTTRLSYRTLTGILGYSASTLFRDMKEDEDCVESKGLDGKRYPASRQAHRIRVGLALQAIATGKTPAEVAKELGINTRTLRRWRSRASFSLAARE